MTLTDARFMFKTQIVKNVLEFSITNAVHDYTNDVR